MFFTIMKYTIERHSLRNDHLFSLALCLSINLSSVVLAVGLFLHGEALTTFYKRIENFLFHFLLFLLPEGFSFRDLFFLPPCQVQNFFINSHSILIHKAQQHIPSFILVFTIFLLLLPYLNVGPITKRQHRFRIVWFRSWYVIIA